MRGKGGRVGVGVRQTEVVVMEKNEKKKKKKRGLTFHISNRYEMF